MNEYRKFKPFIPTFIFKFNSVVVSNVKYCHTADMIALVSLALSLMSTVGSVSCDHCCLKSSKEDCARV